MISVAYFTYTGSLYFYRWVSDHAVTDTVIRIT